MAPSPLASTSKSGLISKQKSSVNPMKSPKLRLPAHPVLQNMRRNPADQEVKILVSNIPSSTNLIDLLDQFEEFEVRHLLPNCDENGKPTESATMHIQKNKAAQLLQKCQGMKIGGHEIKFSLTDSFKTVSRGLFVNGIQSGSGNRFHSGTLKRPAQHAMPPKLIQKLCAGKVDQDAFHSSFNNLML